MTEADEALLWAREDYAKQFRSRKRHIADSILSGFWDIEVEVRLPAHGYRAGSAASAERIKELEAAIQQADKRLQDYADMAVDQAAASAARVAELEAALAKANTPRWFYADEEGSPRCSLEEALEQVTDNIWYLYHGDNMPKSHLVGIETSRPCPTIWGVLQLLTDDEAEARGCNDPWVFTPCATEADARALLKEGDQ